MTMMMLDWFRLSGFVLFVLMGGWMVVLSGVLQGDKMPYTPLHYDNNTNERYKPYLYCNKVKKGTKIRRLRGETPSIIAGRNDGDHVQWYVISNSGGGDCLFHAWLQMFDKAGIDFGGDVHTLRQIVARSITDEQFVMLKDLYRDIKKDHTQTGHNYDLINTYSFMDGVETKDDLHQVLLSPRYWGDELALRALSQYFQVQPVVITRQNGHMRIQHQFEHDLTQIKQPYFFLRLQHQHYELMVFGDQVMFNWNQVNEMVDNMNKKHY